MQLGHRWPASLSIHVGALLPWCQCDCVSQSDSRFDITDNKPRYIVDAADKDALPIAKEELHGLLEKQVLDGIPLLVLGNKSDLPEKLSVDDLIEALDMKSISHREVSCYGISAKEETNLDAVLQWLIKKTAH